jgi:tetratricopeptide (TPR) repeat protein
LAKIRAFFEWEWEDAEQHYQRAIEVSPSYAKAYLGYGIYLAVVGRQQEAIEMARRAVELDPVSASTLGTAGDIYYFTDNNAEALSHYQSAIALQPDGALWYAMQGVCLHRHG